MSQQRSTRYRPLNIKNPILERVLSISTGHVAEKDIRLLEGAPHPLVVYQYEEGLFLSTVFYEPTSNRARESLALMGFSEAFIVIFEWAQKNMVRWINLDADGDVYPELPQFDW